MKRTQIRMLACRHNNPSKMITTMDGELVCSCGVVIEEKMLYTVPPKSESMPSLYHQVENGCNPHDGKVISKKIHINHSSASEFSNICSKLGLSSFVQQRAWKIYHILRSKTYYTRTKCAVFSIYVACRESSQPVNEAQIQDSVKSVLCVKTTPGILSVISEMHDDAVRFGIDTNKGHSSGYYLNLEISKKQHLFGDPRDYDRFKVMVMNNFSYMHGNSQNKAKRAVGMALDHMGVA